MGDDLSLQSGPARDAAVRAAHACLKLSLKMREAVDDEALEPSEMAKIFRNMGECTAAGSHLMMRFFEGQAGQDPPFVFHGELGGQHAAEHRRRWQAVSDACNGCRSWRRRRRPPGRALPGCSSGPG